MNGSNCPKNTVRKHNVDRVYTLCLFLSSIPGNSWMGDYCRTVSLRKDRTLGKKKTQEFRIIYRSFEKGRVKRR